MIEIAYYICIFTNIKRQTKKRGTGVEWFSPSKAGHQLALVIQVLLNLLPHVKDGTVPAAEGSGGTVLQNTMTKNMNFFSNDFTVLCPIVNQVILWRTAGGLFYNHRKPELIKYKFLQNS